MPITFEIDRSKELTIFTVKGALDFEKWKDTIRSYVDSGPTRYELFDINNVTGKYFTSEQVRTLVDLAKSFPGVRPEGSKTALVLSTDIEYGISRVYQTYAQIEGLLCVTELFRSIDDAYEWLGIEPAGIPNSEIKGAGHRAHGKTVNGP